MSQTSKIALGIAVVAVVLLGGFYYWHVSQKPVATGESPEEMTTLPSGAKTDDASIQQDLSSVDAQLQGVQSDNADVNSSISAAAAQ